MTFVEAFDAIHILYSPMPPEVVRYKAIGTVRELTLQFFTDVAASVFDVKDSFILFSCRRDTVLRCAFFDE